MKRQTWQREAVRSALGSTEGFVSAQELHSSLRDGGSTIGLATVYRALSSLEQEGEVDALQQDGENLYRVCTTAAHHHHLICRRCGTALWLFSPEWPDLVHPHASAIDTPLPQPPERTHIMLGSKASWVKPHFGRKDRKFQQYPEESIEDWHRRLDLWVP